MLFLDNKIHQSITKGSRMTELTRAGVVFIACIPIAILEYLFLYWLKYFLNEFFFSGNKLHVFMFFLTIALLFAL